MCQWLGRVQSHVRYCAVFGSSLTSITPRQFQALKPWPSSTTMSSRPQDQVSRANSRASVRSRNGSSSMSRNQSLIKKNIQIQDLKPADVLIERFVAWKAIVQQLTSYFEVCYDPFSFDSSQLNSFKGIADIETNIAKELTKLAGVIQLPFRAGNQFLGEGGLQVASVARLPRPITSFIHHRTCFTTSETRLGSLPTSMLI